MERSYLQDQSASSDSVRLRSGSRAEIHAFEQFKTQRKNMAQVCKMCVKSLVDKSPYEPISDDCPHLNNLCNVLDHMFLHRLQTRWSIFSSSDPLHYWHIIQQYGPPVTVGAIEDMEDITTELGKCRAWLRLSLVQKKLSTYMSLLVNKQQELKLVYMQGAFLPSQELPEVAGILKCLDGIDFNICLRNQKFDLLEAREIDYSPYLVFHQSGISRTDDLREEMRLSTNAKATSSDLVEGDEQQLRDLLTVEREQKNYYEELVSVKETQIQRLQKEINEATKESEKQKKEMDNIILELQEQISNLQMELSQYKRQRVTSPNRRSGFFSTLFGSDNT